MTMRLIQQVYLTSNANEFLFTNIPQTYKDLVIKFSLRQVVAGVDYATAQLYINNVTGGHSWRIMDGNGSGFGSSQESVFDWITIGQINANLAGGFSNGEIYLPDYTNTTLNKQVGILSVANPSGSTGRVTMVSGRRDSTAAITSFRIAAQTGATLFPANSSVTLYGISNTA